MKPVWFIVFAIILSIGFVSCEKGRGHPYTPPVKPQAGKGGQITLNIVPMHRGRNIDSAHIYIKYNTLLYPDSTYDDSTQVKYENGLFVGRFGGLKPGDYFIYSRGWDNVTSEKVWANSPVIIKDSTTLYTLDLDFQLQ